MRVPQSFDEAIESKVEKALLKHLPPEMTLKDFQSLKSDIVVGVYVEMAKLKPEDIAS